MPAPPTGPLNSQRVAKSAVYELNVYGDEIAGTLARAWVHKMQFFLELALVRGMGCAYTADDIAGYEEPPDFSELEQNTREQAAIRRRVLQIRRLFSRPTG